MKLPEGRLECVILMCRSLSVLNDTYMHVYVYNWLWLDSLKDLCLFSFANARLLVEQCFMMEVLLR